MKISDLNLYKTCVGKWGVDSQLFMVLEETSELQKAVCKLVRGGSVGAVIDEIADSEIVTEQLLVIIAKKENVKIDSLIELVEQRKKLKLERLRSLVNG